LKATSAGLLLADNHQALHLMAASSETIRELELFQIQRDEGPCLDCYRGRAPVAVADVRHAEGRWPAFVARAREFGVVSVNAVPMRLHDRILGTLGLFGTEPGVLSDQDLTLAQAFADVASVALIQDSAAVDANRINAQLQHALSSRVIIEQAKGVLAQRGNLDMHQAFELLRRYARDRNMRITEVAHQVVSRTLNAEKILSSPHPKRSDD
jgi:GAF domain-containing protein